MWGKHVEHNGSGYIDTTVDAVIRREIDDKHSSDENFKYHRMANFIKKVLSNNDYVLDGPISIINTKSGRKRRIY